MENSQGNNKQFIITKRIAKHGNQSIVIIPRTLEQHLKPGMTAQFTIEVIEDIKLPGEKI